MGPSVKFVSRINDSFSKKNYGPIFSVKKSSEDDHQHIKTQANVVL